MFGSEKCYRPLDFDSLKEVFFAFSLHHSSISFQKTLLGNPGFQQACNGARLDTRFRHAFYKDSRPDNFRQVLVTSFVVQRSRRIQIALLNRGSIFNLPGKSRIYNHILFALKSIPLLPGLGINVLVIAIELRGTTMPSAYSFWVGQAVILQVAADELRVPLRGVIVGESESAVRFRVGEGWDIDIYKHMILAVEQDNWASILVN
jgi:hypothetical protein